MLYLKLEVSLCNITLSFRGKHESTKAVNKQRPVSSSDMEIAACFLSLYVRKHQTSEEIPLLVKSLLLCIVSIT